MFRLFRPCDLLNKFPSTPLQSIKIRDLSNGKLMRRGAGPRSRQRGFGPRDVSLEPLRPSEWKVGGPILFAFGFSGACICGAAIWEYENYKKYGSKRNSLMQIFGEHFQWKSMESHPYNARPATFKELWASLQDGEKMFLGILALNTAVFLAWRSHKLHPVLTTYFCSNPFGRVVCWPMVLSTFSHYSLIHMGLNMYILHSFSLPVTQLMGKEHFLAFYLSAGVFSSLLSHVAKVAKMLPGLSLGASGAIMGVLGYFASSQPEARMQIAFVPGFSFTADSGLKGLILFDALGLVLGWRLFDHAAHLGGALFGLFWYHWGQRHIWAQRKSIREVWDYVKPITPPRQD